MDKESIIFLRWQLKNSEFSILHWFHGLVTFPFGLEIRNDNVEEGENGQWKERLGSKQRY